MNNKLKYLGEGEIESKNSFQYFYYATTYSTYSTMLRLINESDTGDMNIKL